MSLDVVSLFPSIPKTYIKEIIKENWEFIAAYTSIDTADEFLDIVEHLFKNSYFQYENNFIQQLEGLAMGNVCSPSFANLVVNSMVMSALKTLKDIRISYLKYYVDDFLLIAHKDDIHKIVTHFNTIHPRIQFEHEIENNNQIPFLDILIIGRPDYHRSI